MSRVLFPRCGRRAASRRPARLLQTLEPRLLLSAAPIGHVDVLTSSTIAGWALGSADDGAAALTIEVDINGVDLRAGQTALVADQSRADLANFGSIFHGFSLAIPPASLPPGANAIKVSAIDSEGTHTVLAEQTLTNAPPIGHVDIITAGAVYGWLYDADQAPVQYRVDVNGVAGTIQTANQPRPDLQGYLGRGDLGIVAPGSFAGKTVEVYAIDQPSGQAVLIGSNNHVPVGSVDVATQQQVAGWAYDADFGADPISIRVDIDGTAGVVTALANGARSDLVNFLGSGGHGYDVALPALTPGDHTVAIYAIDPRSSAAPATLLKSFTITNTAPVGHLDINNDSVIAGWAYDADAGSGPIKVSLYIDYQLFQTVDASGARPDLAGFLGSANHGFMFDVSSIPARSHSVTVTMHDNAHAAQDEVVLYDDFVHNTPPTGALDVVSGGTVYGWAYDADLGEGPINVDLYVDDAYVSTISANQPRPDLAGYLGSPDHGYAITLPALTIGSHKVEIFAAESQGLVSQRIGMSTVVNQPPTGSLDVISGGYVFGWAADLDALSSPVDVQLFIDGVRVQTASANLMRGDLTGFLGDGRHGYQIAMPTLSSGLHEVDVYAADSSNGQLVSIGSRLM